MELLKQEVEELATELEDSERRRVLLEEDDNEEQEQLREVRSRHLSFSRIDSNEKEKQEINLLRDSLSTATLQLESKELQLDGMREDSTRLQEGHERELGERGLEVEEEWKEEVIQARGARDELVQVGTLPLSPPTRADPSWH